MILSFRCSPEVKDRIDALIESGVYPDFSTFCMVALENQLILEEADSQRRKKGVVLGPAARAPAGGMPRGRRGKSTAGRGSGHSRARIDAGSQ